MSDLYIDITYPIDHPHKYRIKSNIKNKLILDMLCEVVYAETGKGKDNSKSKKLKTYHIRIGFDLDYDNISIKSDTGNAGLTLGIIMDIIGRMEHEKLVSIDLTEER